MAILPKPTDLVIWAATGDKVSPGSSKMDLGWEAGEKPAHETFNYIQNNWGKWLEYHDSFLESLQSRYFKKLINGFELSQFGQDTGNWFLEVGKGVAVSNDASKYFDADIDTGWPGSVLRKFIEGGNFTAGDANPGLATGLTLTVGVWYHVFVVELPSGNIDVGFDSSVSASNLVANDGVVSWRRIFTFFWNSGFPDEFIQNGDNFFYKETGGSNQLTIPDTNQTATINLSITPTGIKTIQNALISVESFTGSGIQYVHLRGDGQSEPTAVGKAVAHLSQTSGEVNTLTFPQDGVNNQIHLKSDVVASGSAAFVRLARRSYIDRRGKDSF